VRVLALALLFGVAGCTYSPAPVEYSGVTAIEFAAAKWRPVSAETGKIRDLPGLEALARDFPDSGSVRLRLLQAHFGAENTAGVVKEALWLAERGYSFSEGAHKQIVAMAGETALAHRLATLFEGNLQRIERSRVVGEVPSKVRLAESVARVGDQWIVSSIVSKDLFVGEAGSWKALGLTNIGSLAGIAVDQQRDMIWTTSGIYDPTPEPEMAFSGLIGYSRASLQIEHRLATPAGSTPSDLHLASDGKLYASDPLAGNIYAFAQGDTEARVLFPSGTFRSPQGLVTSADQSKLYVSDYRYGIAIVDLASLEVNRLAAEQPMLLDGIDALWRYGDRLIGVQNGQNPMKIVALTLSEDGYAATDMHVLEQAHSEWTEPLGGSIQEGALYYVATGQWDRFAEGGLVADGKEPVSTQIRRLPLD